MLRAMRRAREPLARYLLALALSWLAAATAAVTAQADAPVTASVTGPGDRPLGAPQGPAQDPRARPPGTRASPAFNERLWQRTWEDSLHVQRPAADRRGTSIGEQILDELSDLGNELGTHLDTLSMELVALRFDGRRRRMHVGVGTGQGQYLSFRVGGELHFVDGLARVTTQVELGVAGHKLQLQLPEMEVAPTSYRGERGVEVRLPILSGRF